MGIAEAITLLLELTIRSGVVSQIVAKAQSEGRTALTAEEKKVLTDAANAAEARWDAAIAAAKAAGK
jgi:hypothetical protein